METYLPLLSISVGHGYFSDGEWKGLDFDATPATMKVIKGADVLIKKTNNGIAAFYNKKRTDALSLYAADSNGELRFSFKVYSKDRTFANYTSLAGQAIGNILVFDNRESVLDSEKAKLRLSRDEFVSEKDYREIEKLIAEGILDERERPVPPDFIVDVFIKPKKNDSSGNDLAWEHHDCVIKFNPRRSFWRYFLLGNMNRSDPSIIDIDNRIEFESCGDVVLAGNRPAKVFRSKEAIPVHEISTYRFQLKEQGEGGSRVLIKRLPVASEGRLGMDVINGKNEIVLETYINC
jgi:hypothetical protein